ncbi:GNAT family N-acetyltransferase [Roseateles sp.]|uniref:GNAT family N-acetyltransferase n=1 Tax=Roseateles sp. TaxID=1971397 RepID=UPI003BAADA9A
MPASLSWTCVPFADLQVQQLHDALALRSEVFVVEQQCLFLDIDGIDPKGLHLLGHDDASRLVAYARLLPPGVKAPEVVIGRVVTSPAARGTGAGQALMREAGLQCERLWPGLPVTLHAQARLERFYQGHGYVTVSQPYDEDGIPHIEMRKETPQ